MSLEIIRPRSIRRITGKDGREHTFLSLDVLASMSVYMGAQLMPLAALYERFIGRECLVVAEWDFRDGKPILQLSEQSIPDEVPHAIRAALRLGEPSQFSIPGVGIVDQSTGEVKSASSGPQVAVPPSLKDKV